MGLVRIFCFILVLLIIFTILFPVPVLNILAAGPVSQVISADLRMNTGVALAGIASLTFRPSTAADIYEYLITAFPGETRFYQQRAVALFAASRYDDTIAACDKALSRDPGNVTLMYLKGRALKKLGQFAEADQVFSALMNQDTDNPEYLDIIGDVALEKGIYLKAYDAYTRALRQDPGNGGTWEKRGDVIFVFLTIPTASAGAESSFMTRDLYTEGVTSYTQAMALRPERSSDIRNKLEKYSAEYTPRTIQDLEARYTSYRYLPVRTVGH